METINSHFQEGSMKFENGILYIEYKPKTLIDVNTLYKQIVYRKNITKEQDFFMVVDLRNNVQITDEAVALAAANPSPEHIKAIAVITRYGVDYTRVKLYSVFDKPNIKTKGVLSIEEAKSWFEKLEQENFKLKKRQDSFVGSGAKGKTSFALMPVKLSVLFNNFSLSFLLFIGEMKKFIRLGVYH
jgi:hypothetical protein